ncbi:MAG: oxygen-independent coproporphyrinogen III oxidase [Bacteroidia bacterium]
MATELFHLLQKYDVALPRYTSYPTVPFWNNEKFNINDWKQSVARTFENENGEICLYIHLPFCEELCTYCACNKRITKNHAVEQPYLKAVLAEWKMYLNIFSDKPIIKEIHLGGGTPTFFEPKALTQLISEITNSGSIAKNHEFSVEVHPSFTKPEHLEALRNVGFNRISLGVQDFDPKVQYIINRLQSFEQTKHIIDETRKLVFESVNVDLVYGLPLQTNKSIEFTIKNIGLLKPDRIAFYSYAHVPWKSKGQRRYTDEDVPKAKEKLIMYQTGSNLLKQMGYLSIGMDHFALPEDKLMKAFEAGKLHRNFMGYTTTNHKLLIGLGASSISDTWNAFAQNEKEVEAYQEKVMAGKLPVNNGHLLNNDDLIRRSYILDLMCNGRVKLDKKNFNESELDEVFLKWQEFESDGLLKLNKLNLEIILTEKGRLFVRNISSVLDKYLNANNSHQLKFSKSI